MESGNHIFFISQFLCGFTKMSLYFKVLFKIILTEFVVQLYQVIELFCIVLIIFPEFIDFGSRHLFYIVPFLLQFLEFIVCFVGIFGRFGKFFQAVDNGELFHQVIFFFFILFCLYGASFLFDRAHDIFETAFSIVRLGNKCLRSTSAINKCLTGGFLLSLVQLVEVLFQ